MALLLPQCSHMMTAGRLHVRLWESICFFGSLTFPEWPVPIILLLNITTRMPFEILFVMLIGAVAFPFALGIQRLHENEITCKVFR